MSPQSSTSDLPAAAFLALREAFFDAQGNPRVFELRDKRNTQDDPFDEYVHTLFYERLAAGIACQKASGPLITPDLAISSDRGGQSRPLSIFRVNRDSQLFPQATLSTIGALLFAP